MELRLDLTEAEVEEGSGSQRFLKQIDIRHPLANAAQNIFSLVYMH